MQPQTPSTQNAPPTIQEYTSTPPDPTGRVSRQSFINRMAERGGVDAGGWWPAWTMDSLTTAPPTQEKLLKPSH